MSTGYRKTPCVYIYYSDCASTLSIARWLHISDIDFWAGKNGVILGSIFKLKVHLLHNHRTILYTRNMIGQSIASMTSVVYIFTKAQSAEVNMSPQVVYIRYRPSYCTI